MCTGARRDLRKRIWDHADTGRCTDRGESLREKHDDRRIGSHRLRLLTQDVMAGRMGFTGQAIKDRNGREPLCAGLVALTVQWITLTTACDALTPPAHLDPPMDETLTPIWRLLTLVSMLLTPGLMSLTIAWSFDTGSAQLITPYREAFTIRSDQTRMFDS